MGIAMLLYSMLRVVFVILNKSFFPPADYMVFVGGVIFDLAAVVYVYLPFILASILPLPGRKSRGYQLFLKALFYISTVITVLVSLSDLIYYRFTFKRSTADIIDFVTTGNDTIRLIPQFLKDYFYLIFVAAILIGFVEVLYRSTQKHEIVNTKWWKSTLLFFVWLALTVIASRGGIQLRPITAMEASKYTTIDRLPLVLNTPFTITRTLLKEGIEPVKYFDETEIESIYSPIHTINSTAKNTPNVVLLILESFSSEYIGFYNNGKGYTPFLDSLMGESIVFTNAYANGKKSIEALPSLLAGIPNMMENPYATSIYNNNSINGIGTLLKTLNYNGSFFHGGTNGTMNFNVFAKMAGIDHYYGMNEYPKNKDYDGNWGIFDEPFLRFFADELTKKQAPFFASLFTLSSHHPYTIPKQHQGKFPKGDLEIHESIGYSDYALKQFFNRAKQLPWYENTVFIITADHTAQMSDPNYFNRTGLFKVPLIIANYSDSAQVITSTTQHADMVPLILNMTNFKGDALYFGNNPLSDSDHFAVNYINGIYQLITDDYSYLYDGEQAVGLFNLKTDSLQKNDLLDSNLLDQQLLDKKLKGILQQYTNRMINNKLTITK
tara:strand:- start:2150 stop:3973 length:1824 start_codon:yes stop_codon:yes gene_type:complete